MTDASYPGIGEVQLVADPNVGDLVGLAGDRLVAHGVCRGLPCRLVSVDLHDGVTTVGEIKALLAAHHVPVRRAA